jgi:hypothetical protein
VAGSPSGAGGPASTSLPCTRLVSPDRRRMTSQVPEAVSPYGRPAPMRPSVKMGEYETVEPVNGACMTVSVP